MGNEWFEFVRRRFSLLRVSLSKSHSALNFLPLAISLSIHISFCSSLIKLLFLLRVLRFAILLGNDVGVGFDYLLYHHIDGETLRSRIFLLFLILLFLFLVPLLSNILLFRPLSFVHCRVRSRLPHAVLPLDYRLRQNTRAGAAKICCPFSDTN